MAGQQRADLDDAPTAVDAAQGQDEQGNYSDLDRIVLLSFLEANSSCFSGQPMEFLSWLASSEDIRSLADLNEAVQDEEYLTATLGHSADFNDDRDDHPIIFALKRNEFRTKLTEACCSRRDAGPPPAAVPVPSEPVPAARALHELILSGQSLAAERMLLQADADGQKGQVELLSPTARSYASVLVAWYRHQIVTEYFASAQIHHRVDQAFDDALECNPHVPYLLLRDASMTPVDDVDSADNNNVDADDEKWEEAVAYVDVAAECWTTIPGIRTFVEQKLGVASRAGQQKDVDVLDDKKSDEDCTSYYDSSSAIATASSTGPRTETETTYFRGQASSSSEGGFDILPPEFDRKEARVCGTRLECTIWYLVPRDDELFEQLLGWDDASTLAQEVCISLPRALIDDGGDGVGNGEMCEVRISDTFRRTASQLPFPIRFQLERSILDSDIIPIQVERIPNDEEGNVEEMRSEISSVARQMLAVYVKVVLPQLLAIDWSKGFSLTESELFAFEIWDALVDVKRAIKAGDQRVLFNYDIVEAALERARNTIAKAVDICGSEASLAGPDDSEEQYGTSSVALALLQKRAMWPTAEYRCKFMLDGSLAPAEFELVNLDRIQSGRAASPGFTTRRALRSSPGWFVRDRFARLSLDFREPFASAMPDWLERGARLCGRRYDYLFDKGIGSKSTCWIFAPLEKGGDARHPDLGVSRDLLLRTFGDFSDVVASKLGDRLGLCFSQTAPIMEMGESDIVAIDECTRNGYRFSDGCGVMGIGIAKRIQSVLGLRYLPGAAQVRLGGVKGMLSLDLDFPANQIGIRRSMIKYPSNHRVLEVKKVALAQSHDVKLFRDALIILDAMGVPYHVLCSLQSRACASFVLKHDEGSLADMVQTTHQSKEEEYINRMLTTGEKFTGQPFEERELEEIIEPMKTARFKVNLTLSLSCSIYQGVHDEIGLLEDGEILVGAGSVQGRVLICRSPALFPGDIQVARAVGGTKYDSYSHLDQVVVFSGKGDRPLQDMLGGGDLDGDEYFIIDEKSIVEHAVGLEPHDYESQSSRVGSAVDIENWFPPALDNVAAPSLIDQLSVLRSFLNIGDIVAQSREAFDRVADAVGVQAEEAQFIAALHQKALDARSLSLNVGETDIAKMVEMASAYPKPNWKRAADRTNPRDHRSTSLLSVLSAHYDAYISKLERLLKCRQHGEKPTNSKEIREKEKELARNMRELDELTLKDIFAHWNLDERVCGACGLGFRRTGIQCKNCKTVVLCSNKCETLHWKECMEAEWRGSARAERGTVATSLVASSTSNGAISEPTIDRGLKDVLVVLPTFNVDDDVADDDIVGDLLDIVFGRTRPNCFGLRQINWQEKLGVTDLESLSVMTKVEFYQGFERGWREARCRRDGRDLPHVFDVFLVEPQLQRRNITVAVFLPREELKGMLMWKDKYDGWHPLKPPFHRHRITSLAGATRVLSNITTTPTPGTLFFYIMKRSANILVGAIDADDESLAFMSPDLSMLNDSQKVAVATVSSPSHFEFGIFCVQGPPGTGKTVTLCHMISQSVKAAAKSSPLALVLALAPSNAAVANIALKLVSEGHFDTSNVCVFGEGCDESVYHLSPYHRYKKYRSFRKEYDDSTGRKSRRDKEMDRCDFAEWLGLSRQSTLQDIESRCPYVGDESKGQNTLARIIASCAVVCATLNSAGSRLLRRALSKGVSTIFIDEAAQCPEVESYIAATFPGVRRLILLGDPAQLESTVLDIDCRDMGYGQSLLSHIQDIDEDKVHLLNVQYRCDPCIIQFSNEQFYGRRIKTDRSVTTMRGGAVEHPVLFIDTGEMGKERERRGSRINPFEVNVVKSLLCSDEDIVSVTKADPSARIMVLTPYAAQRHLMEQEVNKMKQLGQVDVGTVDGFQGQEGEIVVLSLVRTAEGKDDFIGDPHRLNVSLTRAKRVLRVVGSLDFCQNLMPSSLLFKFSSFCLRNKWVKTNRVDKKGKNREVAWLPPNWRQERVFRISLTQRFHMALKGMPLSNKYVALNTLIKVAIPDVKALDHIPRQSGDGPTWQSSGLLGFQDVVRVVWVAKEGDLGSDIEDCRRPTVEAHFAGSRKQCLNFVQTHPNLPKGSRRVKKYLSGVEEPVLDDSAHLASMESRDLVVAWNMNDDVGSAILDEDIDRLPDFCFELDPEQVKVLRTKPPLLLESRSGTGKTIVLFQYAIAYAREYVGKETRPILFITVSPTLRRELMQRYQQVQEIERVELPPIMFLSLRQFLDGLIECTAGINKTMRNGTTKKACSYLEYFHSKSTYATGGLDPAEVENEIGGVILGSLEAAIKADGLSRDEYLSSIRSNVSVNTSDGVAKRHQIFDEYDQYRRWKAESKCYDINEIVLELIRCKATDKMFEMSFLDEIQDFSYAAIFLICSIAGKDHLNWVCAGDTAQMISPGCSFTFDGLKQVMRSVRPGIDEHLKGCANLLVNYRTTRDILSVANQVLGRAKSVFPNAIAHARQEKAVKDLKLKVLLVNWADALQTDASFAPSQAVITSADDEKSIEEEMRSWLSSGGFVLPVLESKGLEFLDVVIAFDLDRKAWDPSPDRIQSLRMLRELYVAITRAQRRVVILVKKNDRMRRFFDSLDCDLSYADASIIFDEFNRETSVEEWLEKGMVLFQEEKYKPAASAFVAAGDHARANWAQGRSFLLEGRKADAVEAFRTAANMFFEITEYKLTLDILFKESVNIEWKVEDDRLYRRARSKEPLHIGPQETVKFALQRERFDEISAEHFEDPDSVSLIMDHRHNPKLAKHIGSAASSAKDLESFERFIPEIIADIYASPSRKEYSRAVALYLRSNDIFSAEKCTVAAIEARDVGGRDDVLETIARNWQSERSDDAKKDVANDSSAFLLHLLFDSPLEAARSRAKDCISLFGHSLIKTAVLSHEHLTPLDLHHFDPNAFESEVSEALLSEFKSNMIDAVRWYVDRQDPKHAQSLVEERMKDWSDEELLGRIVGDLKIFPKGLVKESTSRGILPNLAKACLTSEPLNLDLAFEASNQALHSRIIAEANIEDLIPAWYSRRNDDRVKTRANIPRKRNNPDNASLFLAMLFNPKNISKQNATLSMKRLGAKVVEMCVALAMADTLDSEVYSTLQKFDSKAFAHRRPSVKPEPQESKPKASDTAQSFSKGDQVILHGLSKAPALNGKRGKIVSFDREKGRYVVQPEGTKSPKDAKLILPKNLQKAKEGEDSGNKRRADDLPDFDLGSDDSSIESEQSEGSEESMPPLLQRKNSLGSSSSEDDSLPPPLQRRNSAGSSSSEDDSLPPPLQRRNDLGSSSSEDEY